MLIVSVLYSQDTIPITTAQAKQAIRNAQKVRALSMVVTDQQVLITGQKLQLALLQDKIRNQQLQYGLLQENNSILTTQLTIAKEVETKRPWLGKVTFLIGIFASGYLIGSL